MLKSTFPVSGEIRIFDVKNPWVYIPVPEGYSVKFRDMAHRGLVPVTVTLGNSTWDTSLMPMGDGTHFIPLNAKVRRSEGVDVGDRIDLVFMLRKNDL